MQTLAIAKGELWLHRDGQPPRQMTEWRDGSASPIDRHELVETVVAL